MPQFLNPPGVPAPAANYSHVVVCEPGLRYAFVSGQLGIRSDGTVPETFGDQMEVAMGNVLAVLRGSGFEPTDIVKLVVYVTPSAPDVIGSYRAVRDTLLGEHKPAALYIGVAGFVAPHFLVEIEATAAQ